MLRTPKIHEILKKKKGVAVLDQETRWWSTFQLVERLIQLKDIINEMGELKLEPAQWDELINLQDLLKKAYDITIRLQYSDVIPGYFFRKWTGLQLVYEDHGSVLGTEIANSMKRREQHLFNEQLFAAVFLDIVNQDLLSDEQMDIARETVTQVALRLKGIEIDEETEETNDVNREEEGNNIDSDSDEEIAQARKKSRTVTDGKSKVESSS